LTFHCGAGCAILPTAGPSLVAAADVITAHAERTMKAVAHRTMLFLIHLAMISPPIARFRGGSPSEIRLQIHLTEVVI
jgi:hypothetical protein